MRYDIRAELPGSELKDYQFHATDLPHAQDQAERAIQREVGKVPRFEWRGAVVFVNRPVPLSETPLRVMR